jgi:uncharacterized protein (UPF0333 family)
VIYVFKKGQVSTEYLVILAVVLVVALVVVALVSGVTPVSSGVSETQSRNYWTAVSPMAVTGWKYAGTALDLTMQNMDGSKVTLTDISIGGSSVYSTATQFTVGETKTISNITMADCGAAASSFELENVQFTYTKGSITGLIQKGDKPIVGKCS